MIAPHASLDKVQYTITTTNNTNQIIVVVSQTHARCSKYKLYLTYRIDSVMVYRRAVVSTEDGGTTMIPDYV